VTRPALLSPAQIGDEILRWREVRAIVKLSRTTVTKLEKLGRFPMHYHLTDYAVGWRRSDVEAFVAGRRKFAPYREARSA